MLYYAIKREITASLFQRAADMADWNADIGRRPDILESNQHNSHLSYRMTMTPSRCDGFLTFFNILLLEMYS
jgi:hypothetical protein